MRKPTGPVSHATGLLRPTIALVNMRARLVLLGVLAAGWFVLAVVNLVKGHVVVGVAYAVCGAVITTMTLRLSKGRRAR